MENNNNYIPEKYSVPKNNNDASAFDILKTVQYNDFKSIVQNNPNIKKEIVLKGMLKNILEQAGLSNQPEKLDVFLNSIFSRLYINDANIKDASIRNGVLFIFFKDNSDIDFNLQKEWENLSRDNEYKNAIRRAEQKEKMLQKEISEEYFYGDAIKFEYSTVFLASVIIGGVSYKVWQKVPDGMFALHSMIVNTPGWKQKITFPSPFVGSKKTLQNSLMTILNSQWLQYDPKLKKIVNPTRNLLLGTHQTLQKMTYSDYKNNPKYVPHQLSEEQFEITKKQTLNILAKNINPSNYQKSLQQLKLKAPNVLEYLFWPTFFLEANKQQTPINIIKGLTEVGATFWAFKLTQKALRKRLPGWKLGTVIAAGAALTTDMLISVENDATFKTDTMNILKWQKTQKPNYSDKHSTTWHLVTDLGLTTGLDMANDIVRGWKKVYAKWVKGIWKVVNSSGLQKYADDVQNKNIWFDAKISWNSRNKLTDMLWIQQWKNKYTDMFLGHIEWELPLLQHKVNFTTAPWQWMWAAFARDINEWNRWVDLLGKDTTKMVLKTLREYYNNLGPFSDVQKLKNANPQKQDLNADGGVNVLDDKIALLKTTLLIRFGFGMATTNMYDQQINSIIASAVDRAKSFPEKNPNSKIKDPNSKIKDQTPPKDPIQDAFLLQNIRHQTNSLRIDNIPLYVEKTRWDISMIESSLLSENYFLQYQTKKGQPIFDQQEIDYIIGKGPFKKSLLQKMYDNESLFVNPKEEKIYQWILSSNISISDPQTNTTVRKAKIFADTLDIMVEIKMQKQFAENLAQKKSKNGIVRTNVVEDAKNFVSWFKEFKNNLGGIKGIMDIGKTAKKAWKEGQKNLEQSFQETDSKQ